MTGGGTTPLLLLVSSLAHLSLCQDILVQRHCRVLFSAAELAGRALVFCSADYLEQPVALQYLLRMQGYLP